MIQVTLLSSAQLDGLRSLASVLLPGTKDMPAALELDDFDQLVLRAAAALVGERQALEAAIAAFPSDVSWESVAAFAEAAPALFEVASLVVVGAYFMAGPVLASIGTPTGQRRPANSEQVVDELSEGLLDSVLERGCPIRTLDEVNRGSGTNYSLKPNVSNEA